MRHPRNVEIARASGNAAYAVLVATLWSYRSKPLFRKFEELLVERNRAVARAAFAADLPDLIVERRTKGGPDGFAAEVYETHRGQIREQLLGGMLRDHGVIDGTAVEAALSGDAMVRNLDFIRLLQLADAEAWARLTTSRSRRTLVPARAIPEARF